MNWYRLSRFVCVSLCVLPLACGSGEDAQSGDGGADGGNGSDNGIFGLWQGTFSETSEDPDLSLQGAQAAMEFKKAENDGGDPTFKITIEAQEILVSGTFGKFDNETLLFNIKKSNLSAIGEPGTLAEVKYKLLGKRLKLSNDNFSLLSERSANDAGDGGGDDQGGDGGEGKAGDFAGLWSCDADVGGNIWVIEITGNGFFRADIRNDGRAALWQNGSFKFDEGSTTQATLTVEASNRSQYEGDTLLVTLDGNVMRVRRRIQGERDGGSFPCYR